MMLIVVLVIGTACGGGDDDDGQQAATSTQQAVQTQAVILTQGAVEPTWTPKPTRTQPPPITVEYTYVAPTAPLFTIAPATLTAMALVPLDTPLASEAGAETPAATPGETSLELTLTAAQITGQVSDMLASVAGGFFEAPPTISVEGGQLVASLNVYLRQSDPTSARPVIIEASVSPDERGVSLTEENAYFTDDGTPFDNALVESILFTIDTAITDLISQAVMEQRGTDSFTVTGAEVSATGLTIQVTTTTAG
jgi:hypothetical protein